MKGLLRIQPSGEAAGGGIDVEKGNQYNGYLINIQ